MLSSANLTQPTPLSASHSLNDIIKLNIGDFAMVDRNTGTPTSNNDQRLCCLQCFTCGLIDLLSSFWYHVFSLSSSLALYFTSLSRVYPFWVEHTFISY